MYHILICRHKTDLDVRPPLIWFISWTQLITAIMEDIQSSIVQCRLVEVAMEVVISYYNNQQKGYTTSTADSSSSNWPGPIYGWITNISTRRHPLISLLFLSCHHDTTSSYWESFFVGHLSDPVDIPGLAHFCEHMVFLGSEKVNIVSFNIDSAIMARVCIMAVCYTNLICQLFT